MELLDLRRGTRFASLDVVAFLALGHLLDIVIGVVSAFLVVQMFGVNTLASVTVESPSVEGTFDTTVPFNLTTNTEIGSHVRTVSVKSVGDTIFTTEDSDVATVNLDELGLTNSDFTLVASSEPTIGIRRRRITSLGIGTSVIPFLLFDGVVVFVSSQVEGVQTYEDKGDDKIEVIVLVFKDVNKTLFIEFNHVSMLLLYLCR